MTKEYDTIASLWSRFHVLMRSHGAEEDLNDVSGDNSGANAASLYNASHSTSMHANHTPKASQALKSPSD